MFRYELNHILTRQSFGTVDLTDVSFNEPLQGPGQFTGTLAIDTSSNYESIKHILESGLAAIHVFQDSTIIWAGMILSAPYNKKDQTIVISAVEAEAWLDDRLHGVTKTVKAWNDIDQFQITRELVQYA